jgi:MFS family permease
MGAPDSLWATAREIAGIDLAQRHQRGRVISSLHGTYNIGTAMGPFLGGWLTDVFSFKAAFVAYAIATVLSVFLGLAGPDFPVTPATKKVADPLAGWGLAALNRRVLRLGDLFKEIHPDLRATYLALCLATLSSQSQRIIVQSMLPLYAGAYLQLSPTEIGMLFTISGIIVIMMIIPAGFIMDRVGRKWCTVPSTGIPALVFVLIPLTSSFMQLAFLVAVAGLAQGLSLGSVATSTYDVVPAHVRGRLQAVRRTVAELGSSLAPLVRRLSRQHIQPGRAFPVLRAPVGRVSDLAGGGGEGDIRAVAQAPFS